MSDINLDQLDWRPQVRDTTRITIHDNIIHHQHQEETTFGPGEGADPTCDNYEGVKASSSMFTIITTPLKRGETRSGEKLLEIMFQETRRASSTVWRCSNCRAPCPASAQEERRTPCLSWTIAMWSRSYFINKQKYFFYNLNLYFLLVSKHSQARTQPPLEGEVRDIVRPW